MRRHDVFRAALHWLARTANSEAAWWVLFLTAALGGIACLSALAGR